MSHNENFQIIDERKVYLMPPVDLKATWVGNDGLKNQLAAAWLVMSEQDRPMSPVIVGPPGCGKTTLIAAMAAQLRQQLYIFQCTMDTRPEDLVITPVLTENRSVRYQASSLVTAMLTGGICILDEGNRMRDKAWASLAPLLDARRYVESLVIGSRIYAHPEFKIAATMNEDASVFNLPEYIKSRLRPRIVVPDQDEATVRSIIQANLPFLDNQVIEATMKFFRIAENREKAFSLRQAVQVAELTGKICSQNPNLAPNTVVEECAYTIADIKDISISEHDPDE